MSSALYGAGDLAWDCSTGCEIITDQAATWRPQLSQNRLSGVSADPQRSHAARLGRRRPHEEQKSASASGLGPHALHAGWPGGECAAVGVFDEVVVEAKRSARTLAATRASISSEPTACSCRMASNAAPVYFAF